VDHCQSAGPTAEHHRGQHLGEGRRPPGSRFFADRGQSMAGHRVGFPGHCQFLPCLESVPVDGERGTGLGMKEDMNTTVMGVFGAVIYLLHNLFR